MQPSCPLRMKSRCGPFGPELETDRASALLPYCTLVVAHLLDAGLSHPPYKRRRPLPERDRLPPE